MSFKVLLLSVMFAAICGSVAAQVTFVRECRQRAFPKTVPAGDYSGITHINGNKYAVVSDKSATDGFFMFTIDIDSVSGELLDVREDGFSGDSVCGGDCEGIAWCEHTSSFFVCREAHSDIVEFDSIGKMTGRSLVIPDMYKSGMGNKGFESLTYDGHEHLFWTVNESTLPADGVRATSTNGVENILRLQSFGDDLQPEAQYLYKMDAPSANARSSEYAMGVSELLALGDGRLLVLEREFFVPKIKLGSVVKCKLYEIKPDEHDKILPGTSVSDSVRYVSKRLVHSFETRLNLFNRKLANYEGMCIGPTLADGSVVIVLVSDSQSRYAGVLKDWFKTIVIQK